MGLAVYEFWLLPGDKGLSFNEEILVRAGYKNIGEVITRLTDVGMHSDCLRRHIKETTPETLDNSPYCHVFPHLNGLDHLVLSVCYGHHKDMDIVRTYGHCTGGRQLPWK